MAEQLAGSQRPLWACRGRTGTNAYSHSALSGATTQTLTRFGGQESGCPAETSHLATTWRGRACTSACGHEFKCSQRQPHTTYMHGLSGRSAEHQTILQHIQRGCIVPNVCFALSVPQHGLPIRAPSRCSTAPRSADKIGAAVHRFYLTSCAQRSDGGDAAGASRRERRGGQRAGCDGRAIRSRQHRSVAGKSSRRDQTDSVLACRILLALVTPGRDMHLPHSALVWCQRMSAGVATFPAK